ncbi:S-adenosyl-L-methionine-dependent methyltransferase [Cladochytrium replicatum]|nr:S-adenosyl-L-methionine-dependent methyltransferase [Cladochytrium replicatum]
MKRPRLFVRTLRLVVAGNTRGFRSNQTTLKTNTVDAAEVAKFAASAERWWDPNGPYRLLHKMNPVRVGYISDFVTNHVQTESRNNDASDSNDFSRPLAGLRVLDIGCGGGILSESLARMGAKVVGADAAPENVEMARWHATRDPLFKLGEGSLEYRNTTAEQFDCVFASEVIEHVEDQAGFVRVCSELTRLGGTLVFSTINRTALSYLLTIGMAEYVLRLVDPGTHNHAKYVKPAELERWVEEAGCEVLDLRGLHLNPLISKWSLSSGMPASESFVMNYFIGARKLIRKL